MIVQMAEKYAKSALGQEAEALLQPCVQCGQCTPVCPTFRLLNDEWDGPRGRIFLIKQFLEGREPTLDLLPPALNLKTLNGRSLSGNLQLHLDRCLTCRSCETSCPEGVKYGRLLDIARELVEVEQPRPLRERIERKLVRTTVSHRRRFAALLRTGQALRGMLPERLRVLVPEKQNAGGWPTGSHGRRMIVWQGCVQPELAPDINAATARVLDRFGIRLTPAADGCCGSMAHHMASPDEACALMRKSIDLLWPEVEKGVEAIVLTASGCGMHFRDYGALLRDDPAYADKARRISGLTRDISEVVAAEWEQSEIEDISKPENIRRIAFQSSCSLQHGGKLNGVVEKLLKKAGFKLVPVSYKFLCCGAAGTYSILQRDLSAALRESKMKTLLAARPSAIATANIGCMTHLAATSPVPVHHWIQLLDEAFVEAGV